MALSEYFWSAFVVSVVAFMYFLVKMAYKSKCKKISCLGCIVIDRDVQEENNSSRLADVQSLSDLDLSVSTE